MKCPTLASLSVSSYSKSKKKREKQDQALVHWVDVCPVQQGMEEVMPQTPSSSLFVFLSVPRRIFLNINKAERFSQFFLFDLTALAQEIYDSSNPIQRPINHAIYHSWAIEGKRILIFHMKIGHSHKKESKNQRAHKKDWRKCSLTRIQE